MTMTMIGIETAFLGRVASDVEVKTSSAGKPWMMINVAVGGAKDEDTTWLKVVAFGELAERLGGQLGKGDRIYAEGRLKLDTWTGKDGQERTGIKVAAWRVERIGEIGKNKPASADDGAAPPQSRSKPAKSSFDKPIDDEVPY